MEIQPTTEDLIYNLIDEYLSFSEVESSLTRLEDTYKQLALQHPNSIPFNFVDFFTSLKTVPLKKLLDAEENQGTVLSDLKNTTLLAGDRLREVAMEFYHEYQENKINPLENQQSKMRDFLNHCINNADYREKYQGLYTAVRVHLYNKGFFKNGNFMNLPEVNIHKEQDFERWLLELDTRFALTTEDETLIRKLYDPVYGPKEFIICNHCHLPMVDEHNCYNNHVCFARKKTNKLERRKYILPAGELAYIPKAGCIFYNVIPGLEEYRIFHVLKERFEPKGANVELFPNLERNGDIAVSYEGITLNIDVKDYRKPEDLAFKINTEPHRFLAIDYIYIPDYRKFYSDYMNVLRGSVNLSKVRQLGGKEFQFLNEEQLVEDIWIRLFSEGGE
ncbi:hypothetical protein [Rossellomorea aquimaris]|uniref:REase associating with pPIWI RE domain-containing protein n=1 Tax=Rossellomorea aquimaris TaxID=189382 RepID=A0A5D4T7E2_9BACI|nr:hypothetical protein [Rossellomorea aquimaris]TYS71640.1 hypothetical protein FZC80_21620 [Rossellomorea aquimaris]